MPRRPADPSPEYPRDARLHVDHNFSPEGRYIGWGADLSPGWHWAGCVEVVECFAEGGGTSFRLGGLLPHGREQRRRLFLALIEACQAELVADYEK